MVIGAVIAWSLALPARAAVVAAAPAVLPAAAISAAAGAALAPPPASALPPGLELPRALDLARAALPLPEPDAAPARDVASPVKVDDVYASVADLRAAEREGESFRVVTLERRADIAVLAIHGGSIEPGTSQVARAVAGRDLGLYLFEGLTPWPESRRLHVTATHFDDPPAVALVEAARMAVSIHGNERPGEEVCVGGGDAALRRAVARSLTDAGFSVQEPCAGFPGRHPSNIVNRSRGGGVQLELSRGLRDILTRDEERLAAFSSAVRRAVVDSAAL